MDWAGRSFVRSEPVGSELHAVLKGDRRFVSQLGFRSIAAEAEWVVEKKHGLAGAVQLAVEVR